MTQTDISPAYELIRGIVRTDGTIGCQVCCSCGAEVIAESRIGETATREDYAQLAEHSASCVDLKRDCAE